MTDDEILEKLATIIAEQLGGVSASDCLPDSDIFEDLGADTIDAVAISVEIEDQFGVSLEDPFDKGPTVADVVAMIAAALEHAE